MRKQRRTEMRRIFDFTQDLADEMKQSMLEGAPVLFRSGAFTDDTMQLDDDVSQWVWFEHGDELKKLAELMLINDQLESRRVIPDAESQLEAQQKKVLQITEARINELCLYAATKHIEYGDELWRPMVTKVRSFSTATQSTATTDAIPATCKTTAPANTSRWAWLMSMFRFETHEQTKSAALKKQSSKSVPSRSIASP